MNISCSSRDNQTVHSVKIVHIRSAVVGPHLNESIVEREVSGWSANNDGMRVVVAFRKAPSVAVMRVSGTGDLVAELVTGEARVVLLRNQRAVRKTGIR